MCWGRGHVSHWPRWLLFSDGSWGRDDCKALPLFTAGVLQGGGRGAFIGLCLHFWSFLRDTFSHECPAWSHLLRGGLWG